MRIEQLDWSSEDDIDRLCSRQPDLVLGADIVRCFFPVTVC